MSRLVQIKYKLLIYAGILLLVNACTSVEHKAITLSNLSPDAQEIIENPSPSLWYIEGPSGANIYLFGSIHALPPSLKWRTPLYDQVVSDVDALVVERLPITDINESLEILKYVASEGYAKNNQDALLTRLSSKYHQPVRKLWFATKPDLDGDGRADALSTTRPWYYFAMTASSPDIPIKGLQVDYDLLVSSRAGVDSETRRRFVPENVRSIETTLETLYLLSGLDDAVALELIRHRFDNVATTRESLIEILNKEILIRRAWLEGDDEAFQRAYELREADAPRVKHDILITKRNLTWLPKIEAAIEGVEDTLFVLGAGHFPGEDGLIKLLSGKGYTLHKIQGH
jgi:uncharacterized protein YbaP (TraB family)